MSRPVALAIAWGLTAWNGVGLLAFISGSALASVAAPAGILVGLAVGLVSARRRVTRSIRPRLDLDATHT